MATEFIAAVGPGQADYTSNSTAEAGLQCDFTAATTLVYAGTRTSTIADNASVTLYRGGSSQSVTATVVHCTTTQVLLETISNTATPQANDEWRVDSTHYFTISNTGDSAIGIAQCATSGNAETGSTTIDGYTLSNTNYLEWRAASGHKAGTKWSDSIYRIALNEAWAPGFLLSDTYIRIKYIQIKQQAARSSDNACVRFNIGGSTACEYHISHCHFWCTNATLANATYFSAISTGGTYKFWNNIIHDCYAAFPPGWVDGGTWVFYNNTIIDCSDATYSFSITRNAGTPNLYLKNNLVQGSNRNYYIGASGWGTYEHSNNLSEDTYSPDTDYRSKVVDFVDESGGDFALDSTDTDAKDQGTSLASDSTLPFSDDILGVTRSGTWDIGAHEYVSGVESHLGTGTPTLSSPLGQSTGWKGLFCSGTPTLSGVSTVGAGKQGYLGTGTPTLSSPLGQGTGWKGLFCSGTPTVSGVSTSGVGKQGYLGTGTITVPILLVTGVGYRPGAESHLGTGTVVLSGVLVSATGKQGYLGTGTPTLSSPTSTGTGKQGYLGAGTSTMPILVATGDGALMKYGSGTIELNSPVGTGSGVNGYLGTGTVLLTSPVGSGAGFQGHWGTGTPVLASPAVVAVTIRGYLSTGSPILASPIGTGIGYNPSAPSVPISRSGAANWLGKRLHPLTKKVEKACYWKRG